MKQIFINCENLETKVAIVKDGKLEDYKVELNDQKCLVGSVYKGKIHNLAPSLQAAFIDVGLERNVFAHYKDLIYFHTLFEKEKNGQFKVSAKKAPDVKYSESLEEKIKESFFSKIGLFFKKLFEQKNDSKIEQSSNFSKKRRYRGKNNSQAQSKVAPLLNSDDIPILCPEGSEIVVQIEKGPIGTKGAKVTSKVEIPGHYLVLLPNSRTRGVSKRIEDPIERKRLQEIIDSLAMPPNTGCICRTAGMGKKRIYFERDMAMLLEEWDNLRQKLNSPSPACLYEEPNLLERSLREFLTDDIDEIIVDNENAHQFVTEKIAKMSKEERGKIKLYKGSEPLFKQYKLTQQVQNIYNRQVPLATGAYICIDETEALIAIDVNSGKSTGGKDHQETILRTNLDAVGEVARQLRLRNIGGLVVVDFIDMQDRNAQHQVFKAMEDAVSDDKARTKILPISKFGLMEITRQREQESLQDSIFTKCPYCSGRGLVKSTTSISADIQRRLQTIIKKRKKDVNLRVVINPTVLTRLREEDSEFLLEMEKSLQRLGGDLSFRSDANLHIEEAKIIDLATNAEL